MLVPMLRVSAITSRAYFHSLKHDRETSRGVDSTSGDVEVQLSNRDTHSADTEVTETEDSRSIGDNDDARGSGEGLSVGGKEGGKVVLVVRRAA